MEKEVVDLAALSSWFYSVWTFADSGTVNSSRRVGNANHHRKVDSLTLVRAGFVQKTLLSAASHFWPALVQLTFSGRLILKEMQMKSMVSIAFIVGFVLFLSGSAASAGICVVPEVPEAFDRAEAVFVGKIVDVVAARTDNRSVSGPGYIVKFEVEEWWKGTVSRELRILWRPQAFGCPNYSVGDIGETYLVYADSPKSDFARRDKLPEITIFNRTSIIPPSPQVVSLSDSAKGRTSGLAPVYIAPELNRRDASNDREVLRRIRDCECLLPYTLPTCMDSTWMLRQPKPDGVRSSSPTSPCCDCLRRNVTSFSIGFLMRRPRP